MKKNTLKNVFTISLLTNAIIISLLNLNPVFAEDASPSEPAAGKWVNVTKEVYPTIIHPCEPATVTINVTVEGGPAVITRPVAVMFVIDVSGSMNWRYENETGDLHPALYYIKNAANTFIDQMDLTNDTVGVVSFARTATLNQGLTHDGEAAKNAINELTANGATNTGEGIRMAQQELTANCPPNASPIILLFTDGLPTAHSPSGTSCYGNCPTSNNSCTNYARFQANNSKNNDTIIFSIGFTGGITAGGCGAESVAFAEWLLKDIASGKNYYYSAVNATDLAEIYLNISQQIYEVEISDLVVSEYLPSHFTITNDGGGNYSVLPNGTHKIGFTRPFLALNDSWNIEFEITTHKLGNFSTNYGNSTLTYNQDNTSYTIPLPSEYINVISPLGIEKNAPMQVNQGERFNYSINITNIGHMILYNVTLIEILSNKVTFNSVDSNYSGFNQNNWDYNNYTHTLNITNISLDRGDKIGFNISVTVSEDASGYINSTVYSGYSTLTGGTVKDVCNSSATTWVNHPPNPPSNESPKNATSFSTGSKPSFVSWSGGDPDNDTVTYTVYLRKGNSTLNSSHILGNTTSTSYNISVDWNSKYYWKIVAVDAHNATTEGPIWWFKTGLQSGGIYIPTKNQKPVAHASASETYAFVDEPIQFNGSESYDVDGEITNFTWVFDDGTTGYGEVTTHVYSNRGTYNVTLLVTDNDGATDEDTITIVISKANYPPSEPIVDGPVTGHKNTTFEFTALSIDVDNDTIQYIFYWGDGNTTITEFLPNGTSTLQTHKWISYGEYTVSVKAYDGEAESGTTEHVVLIDVLPVDDGIKGYLVDEDSDGVYDFFDNTETGEQTEVEQENNTYLIDSDGDSKWDHAYSLETGLSTYYEYVYQKYKKIFDEEIEKTPGFELTSLLTVTALLVLIILRKRKLNR